MKQEIKVIMLPEAKKYVNSLSDNVRDKIEYIFKIVEGGSINPNIFKKLKGTDIWEFRVSHQGMAHRLFAFWDKDKKQLIIVTHGINKKTQKTPLKEIEKAERIRKEYINKQK